MSDQTSEAAECYKEERGVSIMPVIIPPPVAILNLEEYSSFNRVIAATAWVRRFVSNCRNKERKNKKAADNRRDDQRQNVLVGYHPKECVWE